MKVRKNLVRIDGSVVEESESSSLSRTTDETLSTQEVIARQLKFLNAQFKEVFDTEVELGDI